MATSFLHMRWKGNSFFFEDNPEGYEAATRQFAESRREMEAQPPRMVWRDLDLKRVRLPDATEETLLNLRNTFVVQHDTTTSRSPFLWCFPRKRTCKWWWKSNPATKFEETSCCKPDDTCCLVFQ